MYELTRRELFTIGGRTFITLGSDDYRYTVMLEPDGRLLMWRYWRNWHVVKTDSM